jgi:ethanolamine-phosphate phospho-lyase
LPIWRKRSLATQSPNDKTLVVLLAPSSIIVCLQAPSPDVYRGQFTTDSYPGDDLGVLYAEEVRALCKEAKQNGRTIAGFIAESLQSCGGQVIPPANYLKNVYKWVFFLCLGIQIFCIFVDFLRIIREAGGICIADEVQTGFGRVGKHWWAFQLQGDDIIPDIVTVG